MVCLRCLKGIGFLSYLGLDFVSGISIEERVLSFESCLGVVIGFVRGGSCWVIGVFVWFLLVMFRSLREDDGFGGGRWRGVGFEGAFSCFSGCIGRCRRFCGVVLRNGLFLFSFGVGIYFRLIDGGSLDYFFEWDSGIFIIFVSTDFFLFY